jgi:transcription-repair coupling factor (superfamily II helicase)
VVDEEHRFGVKDKERLKALRSEVDFLALSATPIPRTLHQALTGLRGVSMIQSAPAGRQPVVTAVRPFDEKHAAAAIEEELSRGGQVFYVHNRVRTLPERMRSLQALLPGVRFSLAHGQMSGEELEKAMWDFFHRKADVLVASAIVESGLDIPTVNTMLIENAQDFGLSQLYQLRGRIGRERQKAYCYLYFPAGDADLRSLTEEGRKRLEALREFGELGSGLGLAMRDLEIRGAGDLLGAKQHGFMNAVGVDFYSRMLEEEVARARGAAPKKAEEPVQIDIDVPANIPESYLPGDLERLEFYKKILNAEPDAVAGLRKELEDLSGPAPEPVANLFRVLELRARAAKAGLRSVTCHRGKAEVLFRKGKAAPPKAVSRWLSAYAGRIEFTSGPKGEGFRLSLRGEKPLPWLEGLLDELAGGAEAQSR